MITLYKNSFPDKLSSFNNEQLKQLMIQWNIYQNEEIRQDMLKSINRYCKLNKFILQDKLRRSYVSHNSILYWFESHLKYKCIKIENSNNELFYTITHYDYGNLIISKRDDDYLERTSEINPYTNNIQHEYTYADEGVIAEIMKYNKILKYLTMRSLFMFIYKICIDNDLFPDLIKYIYSFNYDVSDLKEIVNIKIC